MEWGLYDGRKMKVEMYIWGRGREGGDVGERRRGGGGMEKKKGGDVGEGGKWGV